MCAIDYSFSSFATGIQWVPSIPLRYAPGYFVVVNVPDCVGNPSESDFPQMEGCTFLTEFLKMLKGAWVAPSKILISRLSSSNF